MRKFLALIVSIITLLAIRECFNTFTSAEKEIVGQRPILIVIALSIIVPLVILSVWLWLPQKNVEK